MWRFLLIFFWNFKHSLREVFFSSSFFQNLEQMFLWMGVFMTSIGKFKTQWIMTYHCLCAASWLRWPAPQWARPRSSCWTWPPAARTSRSYLCLESTPGTRSLGLITEGCDHWGRGEIRINCATEDCVSIDIDRPTQQSAAARTVCR